MITIAHLRALLDRALTHTANPAILRLPEAERTVEGLAMAYLARRIYWLRADGVTDETCHAATLSALRCWGTVVSTRLDLTDPGTAHALLVALALALDIDPGMSVVAVGWGDVACDKAALYDSLISGWGLFVGGRRCAGWVPPDWKPTWTPYTVAPTVAAEPDPLKALVLAVLHVLGVEP